MRSRAVKAALVGVGALAASALACRRHEPARATDCLRLEGPREPVGFGGAFTITARLDCPDLRAGRVAWRQTEGVSLAEMAAGRDGFELRARMPALSASMPGGLPWGVVPLSPRTRGEIVLHATWTDGGGAAVDGEIRVAAAPRSRGLPITPVGSRVYLGGHDWRLTRQPTGSHAALDLTGGVASLLPDVAGDWRLTGSDQREITLRTSRYDATPLDCGRAGCHQAITNAAAGSPMTSVLSRLMDGRSRPAGYPACALACHATGEPGTPDGGFAHVVSELGTAGDLGRRWEELPRDLHRLGGVGCLACHGPSAIPDSAGRWSVLRADVCAVCHDAPPRYGHVVAWAGTAMAQSDRDERARSDRACARCNTTWGFLDAVATPERAHVDRSPPTGVGPIGITCGACHAVHDPKHAGTPRLLRQTPVPALLAGATMSICLPCHTPGADDARPSASAAALLFGRGGLDPATGAPLNGAAPHATIPGGCIGCHRSGPDGLARGAGHAFLAATSACASCHPPAPPAGDPRGRAQRLWRLVNARNVTGPAHAQSGVAGVAAVDRRTPRGRAAWDLLLVLEDPAAAAHNARYANALLDAAASVIDKEAR